MPGGVSARLAGVVWVAVVEADRAHRDDRSAAVEVVDRGAAAAAYPNPVWWIKAGVPPDKHRARFGQ